MYRNKKTSAFTLVELLVVIAIIGILSSIVLASVSQARANSRDKARISDLAQAQLALKLYSVQNKTYQVSGAGWNDGGAGFFTLGTGASPYVKSVGRKLLEDGLLGNIIYDPLVKAEEVASANGHYAYMIYPSVAGWTGGVCLYASLENPSAAQISTMDDPRITNKAYVVSNFNMNYAACQ